MARTIDIRSLVEDPVTKIIFAEQYVEGEGCNFRQADRIEKHADAVRIIESGNGDYVRVWTKKDAENLKAALDKAISLGWIE